MELWDFLTRPFFPMAAIEKSENEQAHIGAPQTVAKLLGTTG